MAWVIGVSFITLGFVGLLIAFLEFLRLSVSTLRV